MIEQQIICRPLKMSSYQKEGANGTAIAWCLDAWVYF